MALIPEHELQFLLEHVDEAKPWNRTEYKVEMFLRKYFCTVLSAFLAIAVLDPPFDYIFIGIVFVLEITISWRAYDMKMSGKDLVRLMYCTPNPARTNDEYKKYLRVFCIAFVIFWLLHMLVAWQGVHVPGAVMQYPALVVMPALCFYSSLQMIKARTAKGVFERLDDYEFIENHLVANWDGVSSLLPTASMQRVSHSILMIMLYIFWGFGAFALSMFWPMWPGNAPLWVMLVFTGIPLCQILYAISIIPIRAFKMKCFFIDQYRIHHFLSPTTGEHIK